MRPRPYISYSQMAKFEMDPDEFVKEYIYNEKRRPSKNMEYGSQLADGLMLEEANGDPLLDLMASRLPKFELIDHPVIAKKGKGIAIQYKRGTGLNEAYVPILENKGDDIPLLALPDSAKRDWSAFKEYKTSVRKWTQKMADESGQITFYATAMWLVTGKVPEDIELVNIETAYQDDGSMTVTGNMYRYQTKRTMTDVIKMCSRIRKAWVGIKDICEKELI